MILSMPTPATTVASFQSAAHPRNERTDRPSDSTFVLSHKSRLSDPHIRKGSRFLLLHRLPTTYIGPDLAPLRFPILRRKFSPKTTTSKPSCRRWTYHNRLTLRRAVTLSSAFSTKANWLMYDTLKVAVSHTLPCSGSYSTPPPGAMARPTSAATAHFACPTWLARNKNWRLRLETSIVSRSTTVTRVNPERARFLSNSHPMPPAPMRRMRDVVMAVVREDPRAMVRPERRGWVVAPPVPVPASVSPDGAGGAAVVGSVMVGCAPVLSGTRCVGRRMRGLAMAGEPVLPLREKSHIGPVRRPSTVPSSRNRSFFSIRLYFEADRRWYHRSMCV